ncbi:hypothetical protein BU17DRAFT_67095 [Hysterangium stoloniferum]|nr:hypothetical protein BU17DRAFT_67095 [Hysterangium stoloniferum]
MWACCGDRVLPLQRLLDGKAAGGPILTFLELVRIAYLGSTPTCIIWERVEAMVASFAQKGEIILHNVLPTLKDENSRMKTEPGPSSQSKIWVKDKWDVDVHRDSPIESIVPRLDCKDEKNIVVANELDLGAAPKDENKWAALGGTISDIHVSSLYGESILPRKIGQETSYVYAWEWASERTVLKYGFWFQFRRYSEIREGKNLGLSQADNTIVELEFGLPEFKEDTF